MNFGINDLFLCLTLNNQQKNLQFRRALWSEKKCFFSDGDLYSWEDFTVTSSSRQPSEPKKNNDITTRNVKIPLKKMFYKRELVSFFFAGANMLLLASNILTVYNALFLILTIISSYKYW